MKVLIVEDDKSLRTVLEEALTRRGFEVRSCATAAEAQNVLQIQSFSAALVDCMLPVLNGVEFVTQLRSEQRIDMPVILMSGIFRDKQFEADALRRSGAKAFLLKPLDMEQLFSTLESITQEPYDEKAPPKFESSFLDVFNGLGGLKDYIRRSPSFQGGELLTVINLLLKYKYVGGVEFTLHDQKKYWEFSEGVIKFMALSWGHSVVIDDLIEEGFLNKQDKDEIIDSDNLQKALSFKVSPHIYIKSISRALIDELFFLVNSEGVSLRLTDSQLKPQNARVKASDYIPIFQKTYSSQGYWKRFCERNILSLVSDEDNLEFDGYILDENEQNIEHFFPNIKEFKEVLSVKKPAKAFLKKWADSQREQVFLLFSLGFFQVFKKQELSLGENKSVDILMKDVQSYKVKLRGKNPIEIFRALGASEVANPTEVARIYKDFIKTFHPDRFQNKLNEMQMKDLLEVSSAVTNAYDVLVDSDKRQKLMGQRKEEAAAKEMQAESMVQSARVLLERTQYVKAFEALREAMKLSGNSNVYLHYLWAQFKVDPKAMSHQYMDIKEKLEGYSDREKKSEVYAFVRGLLELNRGHHEQALSYFKRSLDYNRDFFVARRELAILKSSMAKGKGKKTDILTGDITSVISSLFKKKSG